MPNFPGLYLWIYSAVYFAHLMTWKVMHLLLTGVLCRRYKELQNLCSVLCESRSTRRPPHTADTPRCTKGWEHIFDKLIDALLYREKGIRCGGPFFMLYITWLRGSTETLVMKNVAAWYLMLKRGWRILMNLFSEWKQVARLNGSFPL